MHCLHITKTKTDSRLVKTQIDLQGNLLACWMSLGIILCQSRSWQLIGILAIFWKWTTLSGQQCEWELCLLTSKMEFWPHSKMISPRVLQVDHVIVYLTTYTTTYIHSCLLRKKNKSSNGMKFRLYVLCLVPVYMEEPVGPTICLPWC